MSMKRFLRILPVLAPLAAFAAQPAPAEQEVVALSPFTVKEENDKTWFATTTLLGSRTNQELAKLPATVDVITADFMRDIGAFNMEDAAQYVSGLNVTPRLESRKIGRAHV